LIRVPEGPEARCRPGSDGLSRIDLGDAGPRQGHVKQSQDHAAHVLLPELRGLICFWARLLSASAAAQAGFNPSFVNSSLKCDAPSVIQSAVSFGNDCEMVFSSFVLSPIS
jgi:hypothetical protein